MEKLAELRRQLGAATDTWKKTVAELQGEAILADEALFKTKEKEVEARKADVEKIKAEISRRERANAFSFSAAKPLDNDGAGNPIEPPAAQTFGLSGANALSLADHTPGMARQFDTYLRKARKETGFVIDRSRHFRSFGEQLQAIFNYSMTRGATVDNRLVRAPTGAGEVDPTGGGFLVQTDFQQAIFLLAHDMGEILKRVNKIPVSETANGIKVNAVDESSRATGSRWGGVQSYWIDEGTTVTNTKPKFRRVEFDLKKLMSVMYMTDELLQDSTALTSIAGQAFSEEIMFMTEDAVYEGTGAGQPLGILNCPALVTVAKQTGQASGTVLKENIDGMWQRMWARSRKNAVWYINQDIEPQFFSLVQVVGTAGAPVYLPPGGYSESPYATLFGRPVIVNEYSAALGSPGDIMLADLSQYTLIDKGGVQAATSMHIAFLTDEMVFRITYRVDGRPMWHQPITPFKGSNTRSPFIVLAQR
jgi:HK97 family phage major capsid protein